MSSSLFRRPTRAALLFAPIVLLFGSIACAKSEPSPLIARPETDPYTESAEIGSHSVEGIGGVERVFEQNVFPEDPTFGFPDRAVRAEDIGLRSNQAYHILRCRGLDIFAWSGTYDEEQTVNALAGFLNRNEPLLYVDATNLTKHGGDDSIPLNYYKQERGIEFLSRGTWQELLPAVRHVVNGIILYEDSAATNAAGAFLVYNLANVSRCLPAQKEVFLQNRSAFEGMRIVAYFKKGIPELSSLNYATTKILPLTNSSHAMCPSSQLDNSVSGSFAKLTMRESFLLTDLAFSKRMFLFNVPCSEYLPTYRYYDRIMRHLNQPGTIWGWVTGGAEAVYSNWGHGLIEGTMTKNGSFHASMPLAHPERLPRLNPAPTPATVRNKVYLCFAGESLDASMFFFGQTLNAYKSASRGQVKMNWGVAAGILDMYPSMAEYLASKATPNDCFFTFTSYSYTHPDQMADREIMLHGKRSEEAWARLFGYSPVQFFLGSHGRLKYPAIARSLPNSSVFVVDSIAAPTSFYPYGYNKYLAPGKMLMDRGPAYLWWANQEIATGNTGRMNIPGTVALLEKVYDAECGGAKPYFFTFWNYNNPETLEDYVALAKALDPKKFEVVDFTTMANYAAQVPRAALDKTMNDRIAQRSRLADSKLTPLKQPGEDTNFASLYARQQSAGLVVQQARRGYRFELRNAKPHPWGGKAAQLSTEPFALPRGARYCVINVARCANGFTSYTTQLSGPFSVNATDDLVMLSSRAHDAASTRSGRVIVELSPELRAYTDKGYPVRMTFELWGKDDGAAIDVDSIRFLSNLPARTPVLRVNGDCPALECRSFISGGVAYFAADEVLRSLGFQVSTSGRQLTASKGKIAFTIDFAACTATAGSETIRVPVLEAERGLYLSADALKAILPDDITVWWDR